MVRESGLGKAIGHVAAAVTLAAAALLCASPAAQADDWIYLQRDSTGLRSFTDVKPGGHYTRIHRGRPTARASCFGLTPDTLALRAPPSDPLIHKPPSPPARSPPPR